MIFRFRLERILQHRQRQLDACARDVAAAQAALAAAEAAEMSLQQEIAQSHERAAAERKQGVAAAVMVRQFVWHGELRQRGRELAAATAGARQSLQEARVRLQQAWQSREVLLRLKASQRELWRQENARRERRALDEIASIRAALAARESGGARTAGGRSGASDPVESEAS